MPENGSLDTVKTARNLLDVRKMSRPWASKNRCLGSVWISEMGVWTPKVGFWTLSRYQDIWKYVLMPQNESFGNRC